MKRNKDIKLDRDYDIYRFQICPFERLKIGEASLIHPLRNEGYEYVIGVKDAKNNRVIEIVNGHSYKYIEMVAGYMLNKQKIIDNKRYAICPINICTYDLTEDEIMKINEIIKRLKNDEEFIDGNYVMTNFEYRDSIIQNNVVQKENKKLIKKRIRR